MVIWRMKNIEYDNGIFLICWENEKHERKYDIVYATVSLMVNFTAWELRK